MNDEKAVEIVIESEFKEIMASFDFVHFGLISVVDGRARFRLEHEKQRDWRGCVYLWVVREAEGLNREIVYVGKAGSTVLARCRQHEQGFGGNGRGRQHHEKIVALPNGHTLEIYVRHSPVGDVLGERVSMCDVEEAALIRKFSPPWNRSQRPQFIATGR